MRTNPDPSSDTLAQAAIVPVGPASTALVRRTLGVNHPPQRIFRRALTAMLAAGAVGVLGAAVAPVAASAAVRPHPAAVSAAAATNYGETPQFHCSYGQVSLDNIRIPYAELPVSWKAVVYYYGSNGIWNPYKEMYTAAGNAWETISTPGQDVYDQQPMYAGVPHGYYYAVRVWMVPNANAGYQPHWDWASLSYGYGTGSYCVA